MLWYAQIWVYVKSWRQYIFKPRKITTGNNSDLSTYRDELEENKLTSSAAFPTEV